MPNVAQKLCRDIVDPVLKRSSANSRVKSTNKFSNSPSILRKNATPTKFVHMDRKASSKTKTLHTNGVTIIKSKTSILKSLAETAVNTIVTGPLKCDNNCLTLVRKRDYQSSCKCGTKRPKSKCSAKSIQTLLRKDYSHMDKACTHYVQTATCGTQFMEKYSIPVHRKTKSKSNTALRIPGSTWKESSLDKCLNLQRHYNHQDEKALTYRYVSAKPWALTNYPIRGPDF